MVEFSLIVPVYNTSKYLKRCLNSVLSQSLNDFELIIIDDGSTDDCPEICDYYAGKDNRIKVYHRENRGLGETRRFGVTKATGEYIWHIDSDDWISDGALEILSNTIKLNGSDVISFNFVGHKPDGIEEYDKYCPNKDQLFRQVLRSDWGTIWKLIAKRHVYTDNKIFYATGQTGGEDYIVVSQILYYAENVTCLHERLYNYNMDNSSSYMATVDIPKVIDQVRATHIVEDFLLEKQVALYYQKELNERKIWAKHALATNNWDFWLQIFPEVNELVVKKQTGFRAIIRKKLKALAAKF